MGVLGPIATVVVDAVSYLLSALGLRSIREPGRPVEPPVARLRIAELLDGWRHILGSPALRPLFVNTALVNGLIMTTAPLMAVLMLGRLGFVPWQYGLAFGAPCVGGLLGSRLARPLASRFGRLRVLVAAGTARACWSTGLVLVRPGTAGLVIVFAVQFGLVATSAVFSPLAATYRLEQTPHGLVARTLSAWSIGSTLSVAVLTALGGVLAGVVGPRTAILVAGLLLLTTPVLLYGLNPGRRAGPGQALVSRLSSLRWSGIASFGTQAASRRAAATEASRSSVRIACSSKSCGCRSSTHSAPST
jgi:MFS family permease